MHKTTSSGDTLEVSVGSTYGTGSSGVTVDGDIERSNLSVSQMGKHNSLNLYSITENPFDDITRNNVHLDINSTDQVSVGSDSNRTTPIFTTEDFTTILPGTEEVLYMIIYIFSIVNLLSLNFRLKIQYLLTINQSVPKLILGIIHIID